MTSNFNHISIFFFIFFFNHEIMVNSILKLSISIIFIAKMPISDFVAGVFDPKCEINFSFVYDFHLNHSLANIFILRTRSIIRCYVAHLAVFSTNYLLLLFLLLCVLKHLEMKCIGVTGIKRRRDSSWKRY